MRLEFGDEPVLAVDDAEEFGIEVLELLLRRVDPSTDLLQLGGQFVELLPEFLQCVVGVEDAFPLLDILCDLGLDTVGVDASPGEVEEELVCTFRREQGSLFVVDVPALAVEIGQRCFQLLEVGSDLGETLLFREADDVGGIEVTVGAGTSLPGLAVDGDATSSSAQFVGGFDAERVGVARADAVPDPGGERRVLVGEL